MREGGGAGKWVLGVEIGVWATLSLRLQTEAGCPDALWGKRLALV